MDWLTAHDSGRTYGHISTRTVWEPSRLSSYFSKSEYADFLDVVYQRKLLAVICSNDAKSCYDCIVHGFTALAALCLGIPLMAIQVMFGTIQQLRHFIQTAYRDSLLSFSGTASSKPIQGLGQGNGAGPAIWAIVSSPILNLVCNMGYGVKKYFQN